MSFPSLVFTTNYNTESNVSPGECHQQHYLVVGCHALLQLHVQITYTESGSLEQLLNLCLGFFFSKEWLSNLASELLWIYLSGSPRSCVGREVWLHTCLCWLKCLCVCAFMHVCVLQNKPNKHVSQTPREAVELQMPELHTEVPFRDILGTLQNSLYCMCGNRNSNSNAFTCWINF